jgi:hypothetical protein
MQSLVIFIAFPTADQYSHCDPQPNTIIILHQPRAYVMTSPFTEQIFSGKTGNNVQSAEFLKTFRQITTYTHIMGDEQIIALFGDHMKYALPTHEWFQVLVTGMEVLVVPPPFLLDSTESGGIRWSEIWQEGLLIFSFQCILGPV